ncbi:PIN domain-containing protein [Amycolatopsis tucumanensis]|uniref:PIN domain-containing protein n=1 Tax=Amycolatopsis tucumanensis TaxID=401106 RepID=UPI003D7488EE
MRSQFWGHYPLSRNEYATLWGEGIVVLDTNALLNLYRYSVDARNDLLKVLDHFQSRIWLPHHVAYEFHENRVGLIREQLKVGASISESLKKLLEQASGRLRDHAKNAFFDVGEIEKVLKGHFDKITSEIEDKHQKGLRKYGVTPQNDPILARVAKLYDKQVGKPYPEQELEKLKASADERYAREVPPGYKDVNKGDDRKYGDFILWSQILDYAKEMQRHVILVTEDSKEDWWWRAGGQTLGPRPELRSEFHSQVGKLFYIYQPASFLKEADERFKIGISVGAVQEVSDTSSKLAELERSRIITPAMPRSRKVYEDRELLDQIAIHELRLREAQTARQDRRANLESIRDKVAYLEEALGAMSDQERGEKRGREMARSLDSALRASDRAESDVREIEGEIRLLTARLRKLHAGERLYAVATPRRALSGRWVEQSRARALVDEILHDEVDNDEVTEPTM